MKNKTPIEMYVDGTIEIDKFLSYENDKDYNSLGLTDEELEKYKKLGNVALDDIVKSRKLKAEIIIKAQNFFREEIALSHKQNTEKLKDIKQFNLNPFLDKYKANFLTGNSSSESIARALIYPRVLGTSINTTFGTKLQKFCSTVLEGYASTTSGIDIEFIDMLDGRKKYCQVKAGPNTINKDDVATIDSHFQSIKNLARTNNLNIGFNDLVVGVFYGEPNELSNHYKKLQNSYSVYIGKEFWHRITGEEHFYSVLTTAIADVASEFDGSQLINEVIKELSKQIEKALED